MKKIAFILTFLVSCITTFGQIQVKTYSEQIRTFRVLPGRAFLTLSEGIVDGSDPENTLFVSFDEMSHDVHLYTYTVTMPYDRLSSSEYLKGFTTRDINDYEHSINTSREYTHYRFEFPNEDMQLTQSGCYRLTIYEDGDVNNKVAEVDFYVVEPIVGIDARVRANTDIEFNGRYQQVDVDVNTSALNLRNPDELRITVMQNNRLNSCRSIKQPTFVEPNRLRFINNKDLIFEAGNEYRHFDAFSCFYAGTGIDRVVHENGDYHALLFADEPTKGQYIHQYDSDGQFIVNAERTYDADTEAEYMWVHWMLPMDKPFFDGALYIGGDLFNNETNLRNRMEYDNESRCYWLTALVKQGGYDYQYWFVPKSDNLQVPMFNRIDGSYWQTENTYIVQVWWKPFGARHEQLVGIKAVQSGQ